MINNIKRIFLASTFFGLALLLSGCHLVLLNPKGVIAADEKHIIIVSASLMLLVVIPVIMLSIVFAWRYRATNQAAHYAPEWAHSTILEIIWWSIPCIIIGILATITWFSSHRLDPYQPIASQNEPPLTIQVIALPWKWLFIYPEQNIATVNFVQFPVGVPVKFLLTAEGAMNSFQIPQLAGQIYAMAGMQSQLNLFTNMPGDYAGMSTNFSGDGFSDMKFVARASTKEQFSEWVKTVKQAPNSLTSISYEQLAQPSTNNAIAYFSTTQHNLFNFIVMKAMMPVSQMKNMLSVNLSTALIGIEK